MDLETKNKEMQMAFDLLDELCIKCFRFSEEETRKAIKEEIKYRFDHAKDDATKSAVLCSQQYLKNMTHQQIFDMKIMAKEKRMKKVKK